MLFLAARRDGALAENPAEFVEGVRERGAAHTRRAFTLDELRAVLAVCDPEWRSMVLCGLYTGQRLSDVANLTWSNIDLQRGELRLQTRKTSKRLIIPLAPPLLAHLETLPTSDDPSQPVHPRAFALLHAEGRTATISNQFVELLAQAGLRPHPIRGHRSTGKGRDAARAGSSLSYHSLRRTATTLLHEAGVPAAVCQALIGHDSEAIHELYVTVGREALTRAAAALPTL
jgi:integrase